MARDTDGLPTSGQRYVVPPRHPVRPPAAKPDKAEAEKAEVASEATERPSRRGSTAKRSPRTRSK